MCSGYPLSWFIAIIVHLELWPRVIIRIFVTLNLTFYSRSVKRSLQISRKNSSYFVTSCSSFEEAHPKWGLLLLKERFSHRRVKSYRTDLIEKVSCLKRIASIVIIPVYRNLLVSSEKKPRDYKTFFLLNSTEHEIFPAHNNCWHFNIYKQEK